MVGIAEKTFQTVKKSSNGNPLRFQNNIPNNPTELRCISPLFGVLKSVPSRSLDALAADNLRIQGTSSDVRVKRLALSFAHHIT